MWRYIKQWGAHGLPPAFWSTEYHIQKHGKYNPPMSKFFVKDFYVI